jgi:hypothetical protein
MTSTHFQKSHPMSNLHLMNHLMSNQFLVKKKMALLIKLLQL